MFKFYSKTLLIAGLVCMLSAGCSQKPKVIWENYKAGKLDEAREMKMPVVLDFYADWCVSCHEIEKYTYTSPTVIEALQGFKRLKVDLTNQNDPEAMKLVERFDVEGLPTIVFLGADNKEVKEARIEGFVEPVKFLETINLVLNGSQLKKTKSGK